jgi:hypothetical protein
MPAVAIPVLLVALRDGQRWPVGDTPGHCGSGSLQGATKARVLGPASPGLRPPSPHALVLLLSLTLDLWASSRLTPLTRARTRRRCGASSERCRPRCPIDAQAFTYRSTVDTASPVDCHYVRVDNERVNRVLDDPAGDADRILIIGARPVRAAARRIVAEIEVVRSYDRIEVFGPTTGIAIKELRTTSSGLD